MVMKKVLGAVAITAMSAMLLAGCENMSANEQRIGAAALGGAIGGGAGSGRAASTGGAGAGEQAGAGWGGCVRGGQCGF